MCARAATQAAGRSHVKDGRLCYAPQLRRPRDLPGVRAGSASRGQHQLQFEFEPTGTPGVMQGKGSPGRVRLYVDGQLIAQNEFPVTTPSPSTPAG